MFRALAWRGTYAARCPHRDRVREEALMIDAIFVAVTLISFAVLGLIVRGVERL